jgi:hypothetical protein
MPLSHRLRAGRRDGRRRALGSAGLALTTALGLLHQPLMTRLILALITALDLLHQPLMTRLILVAARAMLVQQPA